MTALTEGSRIGAFHVGRLLGEGGMGKVYRAIDTRLNRQVALKILPEAFASDPGRLARFQREAQLLASLNHPGIAAIYGIEEAEPSTPSASSGSTPRRAEGSTSESDTSGPVDSAQGKQAVVKALVLELVEGPTLADRIAEGPTPVDEALAIAKQIAGALEAAHEQGIIHRDLKPANIKLKSDGTVKVLDFGLAKALDPAPDGDPSQSPTVTAAATEMGVILGTAAYMSPEQARGMPVDKRADIWAFGCVLYELLTGRRAFAGERVSDVLASVLTQEPDWSCLPDSVSPLVRSLLERCLDKNLQRRVSDLSVSSFVLDHPRIAAPAPPVAVDPTHRRWRLVVATILALVLVAALSMVWYRVPADSSVPVVQRFVVSVDTSLRTNPGNPALSPDGRYFAYSWGPTGRRSLSLVTTEQPEGPPVVEIGNLEGQPFFSPDSQWMAFFAGGELRKVPVRGGPATVLAESPTPRGGSWGDDGTVVYAPTARGALFVVDADGGAAEPLTGVRLDAGETGHRFPSTLPHGRGVLYVVIGVESTDTSVAVLDGHTGDSRILIAGATDPTYVPSGHLLFRQEGDLLAAPFDLDTLVLAGTPVPVVRDAGGYAVSNAGLLVYRSGALAPRRLVWVDRNGGAEIVDSGLSPDQVALSPDADRIVMQFEASELWMYSLVTRALERFDDREMVGWPVWMPDGTSVLYSASNVGTLWDLYRQPADGGRASEPVLVREGQQYLAGSVSPDGRLLVYHETHPVTAQDLWLLSLEDGTSRSFADSPSAEATASFSPDGRFVTYVSDASGRFEVYVLPLSGEGRARQVSNEGGVEPRWLPNGELVYRGRSQMMAVSVQTEPDLAIGRTEALFDDIYIRSTVFHRDYDTTADGQRFLMIGRDPSAGTGRLNAVVNWLTELERLVPPP